MRSKNILIFAEGNGFGHVARERMLAEHFAVPMMTFGKGAEYCKKEGLEHIEIPGPYIIATKKQKVRIVTDFSEMLKFLRPNVLNSLREHFAKADVLIIDGSPWALTLAQLMRKKTLFITNDTSALVGIEGMVEKKVGASRARSDAR